MKFRAAFALSFLLATTGLVHADPRVGNGDLHPGAERQPWMGGGEQLAAGEDVGHLADRDPLGAQHRVRLEDLDRDALGLDGRVDETFSPTLFAVYESGS